VEFGSIAFWLGAIAAVVIVILVMRGVRSRVPRTRVPEPGAPPVTDDTNYLDSSHISGPIRGRPPGERSDGRPADKR
jgi:hypothetical protein